MGQPYLLVFTIGPVQSFIAQARKTKDLYYGSYILSFLANVAIKELKNRLKDDCHLIFPNEETLDKFDILSIPNRFLAEVVVENSDEVRRVADVLEDKVRNTFIEYGVRFIDSVRNIPQDRDEYKNQLRDLLEIYWVAVEKKDYKTDYINLEKTLGAVKNIRKFKQLNEQPGRKKCSICGQHNALVKQQRTEIKNEELCAVCWTKRNLEKAFRTKKDFPSTAKVAAFDSIYAIEQDEEGRKIFDAYINIFSENEFNEELLFKENITKQFFSKYNLESYYNERTLHTFELLEEYRKTQKFEFKKYYAILMLDGDDMGKWLSGAKLEENVDLQKFHKSVSLKLVEYTNKVNKIITEPKGKVVYSGGDDVLAFVNLNYLLDVLNELRKEFPQFLDDKKNTTASCGVCIAHYKTPLNQVLEWARKAENNAKEMNDKDALSVTILKHSGEITSCSFKWYNRQDEQEALMIIKDVQNRILNNILHTSILFKIQEAFRGFKTTIRSELLETEVKRLVSRSLKKELSKEEKKNNIKEITDNLVKLYNLTDSKLDNYFSLLDFIAFLVRGESND